MSTIAEKLALLLDTKTAIKNAIEAKGVPVGDIPFSKYPEKIQAISAAKPNDKDKIIIDVSDCAVGVGENMVLTFSLDSYGEYTDTYIVGDDMKIRIPLEEFFAKIYPEDEMEWPAGEILHIESINGVAEIEFPDIEYGGFEVKLYRLL